jgi:hypothetical protein
MKKAIFFAFCFSAAGSGWGFTPVGGTTPNAYMVENTTGTDPSGNACYDFQTKPTCSARITNLAISTASIAGGSTQYIQNTGTPTTATQVFKVDSGTIVTQFNMQGTERIFPSPSGLDFLTSTNASGATIFNNVGLGLKAITISAPNGLGIGTNNPFTNGTPMVLFSSTNANGTPSGSFAVAGSSNDATATYSGFIGTNTVAQSVLWSLPKADGTNGQVLATDGSAHLSFVASGTSLLSSTNTWTAQQTFSSATVTTHLGLSGELQAGTTTGTPNQYLMTNGAGIAPSFSFSGLVVGSSFSIVHVSSATAAATFVPTNLTFTYTPKIIGSTQYILFAFPMNGNAAQDCFLDIFANAASLDGGSQGLTDANCGIATSACSLPTTLFYPRVTASLSAQTYTVYLKTSGSTCTLGNGTQFETIGLIEIAP